MRPRIKQVWVCPKCGRELKLFVNVTTAPTCRAPSHSTQTAKMNLVVRTVPA